MEVLARGPKLQKSVVCLRWAHSGKVVTVKLLQFNVNESAVYIKSGVFKRSTRKNKVMRIDRSMEMLGPEALKNLYFSPEQ